MQQIRRKEFSTLSSIYLNAAYMGPLPNRTRRRVVMTAKRCSDPSFMDYGWVELPETVRKKIARLLGGNADDISLNSSTSEAVSAAAFGLALKKGDRIALLQGEYPSDVVSWMVSAERSGATVDLLPASLARDPDALVRALHPRVRLFGISHVSFQTGTIVDPVAIGSALRKRDILYLVDITQSFGGMPIDARLLALADIMPCSVYKWLLSPYGQAFCYWSKRAQKRVRHTHAGWLTMPQAPLRLTKYTTRVRRGARKFDRGQTPNLLGLHGLDASLDFLAGLGLANVYRHNQELMKLFVENYGRKHYRVLTEGRGSNIIALRSERFSSEALQRRLRRRGIDVSVREGNLRASFHLYNTAKDIEALLETMG